MTVLVGRHSMAPLKKVGEFVVALGEGTPKQGEKNALSPVYRCVHHDCNLFSMAARCQTRVCSEQHFYFTFLSVSSVMGE